MHKTGVTYSISGHHIGPLDYISVSSVLMCLHLSCFGPFCEVKISVSAEVLAYCSNFWRVKKFECLFCGWKGLNFHIKHHKTKETLNIWNYFISSKPTQGLKSPQKLCTVSFMAGISWPSNSYRLDRWPSTLVYIAGTGCRSGSRASHLQLSQYN